MHNNIKNNEHDAFSESIRKKLNAHQTPVEPALWDAIAAGINATKPKRKIPFAWWISAGLAAAVALLLFVNLPVNQDVSLIASKSKSSAVEKSKTTENVVRKNEFLVSTSNSTILKTKPTLSQENKADNNIQSNKYESANFIREVHQEEIVTESIAKVDIDISTDTNVVLAQIENGIKKESPTESTVSTPNSKPSEKLQLKKEDWTDPLKEKNKNDWELVAMVGSAGKANSNSTTSFVSDYKPRMGVVSADRTNIISGLKYYSDKTFLAPMSAGFAVAHNISQDWSIESGFTYTYLLTVFKDQAKDSKLHLHYIGLPVRVVYDFLNNNKWSFYASAGGMVEKGVWLVCVQNEYYPGSTITTTVTDKINGWQYSANTSVGGAYKIYKNTSIYFEPKLSYYFDTDQPISIRTKNKVVVGFEGGLRYKF